jgi:hypothetical protein
MVVEGEEGQLSYGSAYFIAAVYLEQTLKCLGRAMA